MEYKSPIEEQATFLYGTSHHQTTDFRQISWPELVKLCSEPAGSDCDTPEQAKENSHIIGAHDGRVKTKNEVLAHNNFTLLRLDLDDVMQSIEQTATSLKLIGIESFIIHTTAKHRQGDNGNRYRVYIALAYSIPFSVWATVESYLCYLFGADDCATRPAQIMYLPTHFEGIKYSVHIEQGKPLDLEDVDLIDRADLYIQQLNNEQASKAPYLLNTFKPKRQRTENILTGQISIIDAVNEAYTWKSLLLNYGYKRQGKAWLPPESTSGKAGVYILISPSGKERYYSHHDNDRCNTNAHCLDKFDFISIREFDGNEYEALLSMGKEFPEITTHNQSVWRSIKGTI